MAIYTKVRPRWDLRWTQKCDTEKVQQVVPEAMMQLQKMQATADEKLKRVETVVTRVDELSGESMNVRNRLEGVERRLGLEGQQQQDRAADQCRGDIQGLTRCSTEFQMDIQSRDQRHLRWKS